MRNVAAIRWLLVLGALACLEAACRLGLIKARVIIPPSRMVTSLAGLLAQPATWETIGRTAGEILVSFVTAVLFGFVAGLALHALPRLRAALIPLFAAYYAVPLFIFYPVFVAIFGLSTLPIMITGFLLAVVAMILATLDALDRIPRVLDKLRRLERMGPVAGSLLLKFPAAAPGLFAGIKLAASYSFVAVIASEFLLAPGGLGYAISFAYNTFDSNTMYGLILFVVILVLALNGLLNRAERRIARAGGAANSVATDIRRAATSGAGSLRDAALILVGLLLAWQAASAIVGARALPSPLMVAAALPGLFDSASFWASAGSTLLAVAIAFLVSVVAGVAFGVAIGASRVASEVVEPLLMAAYAVPKVVLFPIVLLACGIGLLDKVVFGVMHGFIPIAIFSVNAVHDMRPIYHKVARSLDLTRWQAATTMLLPAALPRIYSGVRIGFSLTLLGTLVSEMFAAKAGLGHVISISTGIGDLVTTIAVAMTLFAFAIAMDLALVRLGRLVPATAGAVS